MPSEFKEFWSLPADEVLARLETSRQGLSSGTARERLDRHGPNVLKPKKRTDALTLLAAQFKSPLVLILTFAAGLAFLMGDRPDAFIILFIILASGLLGFWQEKGASDAVRKLIAIVQIEATVLRDGQPCDIPVEEIVPGDILVFKAGDTVPADCLLLDADDFFADEAVLTGETYPAEKTPGVLEARTPLAGRTNTLFMGTHVISGGGSGVVVATGRGTEFGGISDRLKLKRPEPEFERGVRRFGYLLAEITFILVFSIFAINVFFKRPVLDSFLFALALAVGLTPQLLPAIISINLSHGARRMAREKVIIKRLAAIENFGSMNVLCADKTGTLTEGKVRVRSSLGIEGREHQKVLFYAFINASFETGFKNPIDEAIRGHQSFDLARCRKLDEVPYDFVRKRLSILASVDGRNLIITKGAFAKVLEVCAKAETLAGEVTDLGPVRDELGKRFEALSREGYRVLGVAYREAGSGARITRDDETDMTFLGTIVLFDPVKPGIVETLARLKKIGVSMKLVTGDNRLVAAHVGQAVGLSGECILTGGELGATSELAIVQQAGGVDIFAEIEPSQKERIILALRKAGNVVGYMGDGINDASALHAADVGISVDSAVDVAKDAADIVLLEADLGVLVHGIEEGRKTFANTLKYVFMAASANFGNMFSMAGASLFLPFLPLLPTQILLTNLLTDFPEMTIATDAVDREFSERPRRWDLKFIHRFMLAFGLLSSVFDYITFGALLLVFRASTNRFRTGWFLESVLSAAVIVLVVRTRRPFYKSRPGKYLLAATLAIVAVTVALPFSPLAGIFHFEPLPLPFFLLIGAIILLYVTGAEITKRLFYRRMSS
ncbi:MAG: magnesium-translocating P-type ATPase [Candidatus Aminicenantales bacterium]